MGDFVKLFVDRLLQVLAHLFLFDLLAFLVLALHDGWLSLECRRGPCCCATRCHLSLYLFDSFECVLFAMLDQFCEYLGVSKAAVGHGGILLASAADFVGRDIR